MKVAFYDCLYKYYYLNSLLKPEVIAKINNQINSKIEELNNSIDDIVKNEKSKKLLQKKNEIIERIISKLNFEKYIEKFVSNVDLKTKENKSIHKNVLLVGRSGVGKSTLINSFLKEEKAKAGIGKPITQGFDTYIVDREGLDTSIRLIDSKGIENNSFKESIDRIKLFISQKLKSSNKDQFIHCIWYCITETRFYDEDKESIKSLLSSYEDDYLPIIIVYTKAVDTEESSEFIKSFKEFLSDDNDNINDKIEYISILAKDKQGKKAHGIKSLEGVTLSRIKQANNSPYYQSIRERIIDLYKFNIDRKYENIKDKAINMINVIQYHSINLLNFELIFLELLNLFFFNDNEEHHIKNLLIENNINKSDNELNIINLTNEENVHLTQFNEDKNELTNNNDFIYNNFLSSISKSYEKEFDSKLYSKYIEIIENCFKDLTDIEVRQQLFKKIDKEFRQYKRTEIQNNLGQINDNFINLFKRNINFQFEENNNINSTLNDNLINVDVDEGTSDLDSNYLSEMNNLKSQSKEYKINNNNILKIKETEHKIIIEILKYFSSEILECIKQFLLDDKWINNLKSSIEKQIISKVKDNINYFN